MDYKVRFLVVVVTLVWGFNFVVIRWGVESIDPAMMTALRFFFTSVPLIFFVKKPTIHLPIVAMYGVFFGAGLWGLMNLSIALGTPSGMSSLLLQSSAFLTVLVAVLFFDEKINHVKKVGIGVAFIGFTMVLLFRSEAASSTGVVLVILAAVFWTICNVIIKKYKPADIVGFIVWSSLFVPVPVIVFSVGQGFYLSGLMSVDSLLKFPSAKAWVSILFQSYVVTLLGYGIWTWAITKHGLSNVAPFSLLIPVSGLFFGWLLYDEALSAASIIGSLFILLGLALLFFPSISLFDKRENKERKV
ncbi:MAG: O-acetylserine/cysteine efflux transporter [Candidatus Endobugula sp.]